MPYIDFVVGEDIESVSGDIPQLIGEPQNAEDLIVSGPGNFFRYPTMGIGIVTHVNSEYSLVQREKIIRAGLKRDNFTITYFKHSLDSLGDYVSEVRAEK